MELFGVGLPEIGIVLLIALVIVGPQRFPEVARQVARWINTARSFSDSVMADLRSAVDELEQEVTAQNDGVNPIKEIRSLRDELTGVHQNATAAVADATSFPSLNAPSEAAGDSTALRELVAGDDPAGGTIIDDTGSVDTGSDDTGSDDTVAPEPAVEETPAGEPRAAEERTATS